MIAAAYIVAILVIAVALFYTDWDIKRPATFTDHMTALGKAVAQAKNMRIG